MTEHHYLCNDPNCPDELNFRQVYSRDIVGTSIRMFPCKTSAQAARPNENCDILLRYVGLKDSFCSRLEVMRGNDGRYYVYGTETSDVWLEEQANLLRGGMYPKLHPPSPEVELLYQKHGLSFEHRMGKYWNAPTLMEIAQARIDELLSHEKYVTLVKDADRWLAAHNRRERMSVLTPDELRERKSNERRRKEVDSAGLPEPTRGRSNIWRKAKTQR